MSYQEMFEEFWGLVKKSTEEGTFAKLTMAKTIGKPNLKNIFVRPTHSDKEFKVLLKFSYRVSAFLSSRKSGPIGMFVSWSNKHR